MPYLSRFYRVVRPDARGLGASSADFDLERELTVESLVEDLDGDPRRAGAASVHFCGESMGGILGLALAAMHPERVRTLTLVSTPVYISDKMKETYSMGHKSRVDAMKEMGREAWLKATNRSTRFPPETRPRAARLVRRRVRAQQRRGPARLCEARERGERRARSCRRSRRPCSACIRPRDRSPARSRSSMLLDNLRDFRIVHLPTRYHMVHHIAPAACATHLLHFIAQHDGMPCRES